jgi:hypothetical protein
MPDEQPIPNLAVEEARVDWAVLDILIGPDVQRPWSIAEVARAYGNEREAIDGLNHLHGAGLIHKTQDGFVFATRAAVRFNEIKG